jgi:hypothetical protein
MIDYINPVLSVLITGLLLAGFLAMGALLVFELGTVFVFWITHRNGKTPRLS